MYSQFELLEIIFFIFEFVFFIMLNLFLLNGLGFIDMKKTLCNR